MIIAVVNNNVVTEITPDVDPSLYGQYAQNAQAAIDVTAMNPQPQVGWTFNGNTLIPSGVVSWKITDLAFLERFTMAEQMAIKAAEIGSGTVALTLQVLQGYANAATYVDLSRIDTQTEIGALVSLGLLTQARATQILTTPPTAIELYQG